MFDSSIKFKYSWRPYQDRVLKQVEKYIKDINSLEKDGHIEYNLNILYQNYIYL